MQRSLDPFLVGPRVVPPLDPGFRPAVLARRRLETLGAAAPEASVVWLAVEQPSGAVFKRSTWVFPDSDAFAQASVAMCERLLKSMLWGRGGSRVWVDGPEHVVAALRRHYAEDPAGAFDAAAIEKMFLAPLEIVAAPRTAFPVSRETAVALGGNVDGCRIGFDLGASDRKAAAVVDGEAIFSEEIGWDPANRPDPQWHYDEIMDSLRRAAAHLPRVDAIGGSAAGVYVNNEVRSASLFRSVPAERFDRARNLFHDIQAAWGGVPLAVANDGDVTALAGAMSAGVGGLLGIAMGSSEAGGYTTPDRRLTPWLNELAFTPIDYAPDAPVDEWSGDRGCGVRYLSQQCLPRLLPAAGIEVDEWMPLPERLVTLQRLTAGRDERAAAVYETIGVHLGYALLEYADFYEMEHVLVLGRVTSGPGGTLILDAARRVLAAEAPERRLEFHEASERDKRHGQAVAAASLPALGR